MLVFAAIALLSYLLGSIPFGFILVRVFRGEDIRQSGSGNIGATNVARKSPMLGAATLLLDAGKGFLAVFVAPLLNFHLFLDWAYRNVPWTQPEPWPHPWPWQIEFSASLAALFAVAGHIFSPWLRFRGGKGVAAAIGSYAALAPDVTLLCGLIFAIMLAAFRFVSLASCTAIALFPVLAYLLHGSRFQPAFYAMSAASAVLIVFKHRDNIQRLLRGTEPPFEWKRP